MSVPQHGLFCITHTFPTKCRHCSDDVFFCYCTCGSQVFFDKLGPPWPEHNCAFSSSDERWAKSRRRTKLADGGISVEIADGVTAIRRGENRGKSLDIDPKVAVTAKRDAQSRESNPIVSVPPGEDWTKEIVGVIRELDCHVDVYQRLKLPRTPVTKGFLGDLGSGEWGRMTIHVLESSTATQLGFRHHC